MTQVLDIYAACMRVIGAMSQRPVTLTRACREAGITVGTYRKYILADKALSELHDEAMQNGYDMFADILVSIDSDPDYGTSDSRMASVISSNIKWLLEKRKPKDYGIKSQVEVTLTADRAIIDALVAARDRVLLGGGSAPALAAPTEEPIDATFDEISEEDAFLAEIGAV